MKWSFVRSIASLAALSILTGCATPINVVFNRATDKQKDYTFQNWIDTKKDLNESLIVLSFSGGGLRAATLAASVISTLKENGLDERIAVISSTSGGSVTAGYFAAKGANEMEYFRNEFLLHNNTLDLTPRLLPTFITGGNRSLRFADYLDERLFGGKQSNYKDLIDRWPSYAPFVILNASDTSSGRTFEFTQDSFSHLCSDLAPFRISAAMAASAAFPFLMTPISLKNLWSKNCPDRLFDTEEYLSKVKNRYINLDEFVAARYAHSLRYTYTPTEDPHTSPYKKIEFVHLIDGGLSDNLAARALVRAFSTDTVEKLQKKGVKRILLIQVNAKTEESRPIDHSSEIPSWIEIFKTTVLNPIDVATELSAFISKEYWVSLIRYVNATTGKDAAPKTNVLRFYPVQVDFDQLDVNDPKTWKSDRKRQKTLKEIGTNWTLPKPDVELVEMEGRKLLLTHPCFQTFIWESENKSGHGKEYPAGCDKIDVEPKGDRYGELSPPAAPAAAAGVKPSGEKITVAADALFDFNKAVLRPAGKAKLDELVSKAKAIKLEVILAVGHTDRVGGDAYNQKLSEKRAAAVKEYLVAKGIEANRVYTEGKGEKQPVTGDKCKGDKKTKGLIDCLQPDRRVDIEVIGTK